MTRPRRPYTRHRYECWSVFSAITLLTQRMGRPPHAVLIARALDMKLLRCLAFLHRYRQAGKLEQLGRGPRSGWRVSWRVALTYTDLST